MPDPKAKETESDFVSRFISSEEAQRDFPDEGQRTAVAYAKYREKKNMTELCSDCGAEMAGNAEKISCTNCGLEEHNPTPTPENRNSLSCCRHPGGEHDDIGCKADECPCFKSGAVPSAAPAPKVLKNAGKTAQALWDGAGHEQRVKWLKETGSHDEDAIYDWSQLMAQGGSQADVMKDHLGKLAGENKNEGPDFQAAIAAFESHAAVCATCGPVRNAPAGSAEADAKNLCPTGAQLLVADLENSDKFITDPKIYKELNDVKAEIKKFEDTYGGDRTKAPDGERGRWEDLRIAKAGLEKMLKNAEGPEKKWLQLSTSDAVKALEKAGLDKNLFGSGWANLTDDEKSKLSKVLENASMEAFEEHIGKCNACKEEYSNEKPDSSKLCDEGQKILTSENAGMHIDSSDGAGVRYGTMQDADWIRSAKYGDTKMSATGEKLTYLGSSQVKIEGEKKNAGPNFETSISREAHGASRYGSRA